MIFYCNAIKLKCIKNNTKKYIFVHLCLTAPLCASETIIFAGVSVSKDLMNNSVLPAEYSVKISRTKYLSNVFPEQ